MYLFNTVYLHMFDTAYNYGLNKLDKRRETNSEASVPIFGPPCALVSLIPGALSLCVVMEHTGDVLPTAVAAALYLADSFLK